MDIKKNGAPLPEKAPDSTTENHVEDKSKDNNSDPSVISNSEIDKETVSSEVNDEDTTHELENTPVFPNEVYSNLPKFLADICKEIDDNREKDVFLVTMLGICSGMMDSISGIYDHMLVNANLFVMIVAPPASKKGTISYSRNYGEKVDDLLLTESRLKLRRYKSEKRIFDASLRRGTPKGSDPEKPPFKILYVPANTTAPKMVVHLNDAKGSIIICETEIDAIGNMLKMEWGDYSELLRKAFQHEPHSQSRKSNDEFEKINRPQISIAITGTPSQITSMIKSVDDGLVSRFIFYTFKSEAIWRDCSPSSKRILAEHFKNLPDEGEKMYQFLKSHPVQFDLSSQQWERHHLHFSRELQRVNMFENEAAISSVKRLGLIVYRIAMILSAIRKYETKSSDTTIICSDSDFETALKLGQVCLEHVLVVLNKLTESKAQTAENKLKVNSRNLYYALPTGIEFERKLAVEIGNKIAMAERTVDKHLAMMLKSKLFDQPKAGFYFKPVR